MKKGAAKKQVLNSRMLALNALGEVLDHGRNLSDCQALKNAEASRDRSHALHLAFGVLRWQVALQWLESRLLKKPLKAKDQDLSRLLWLGMFQLWQDRTPDHAAINETTECARTLGKSWATGLINGVLRRFLREQAQLLAELQDQPEHWAHPAWLLDKLQHDWPDHWQDILEANNQAPPLWIRVNTQRASAEDVQATLADAGFTASAGEWTPNALQVEPAAPVADLPGFAEGHFSVQDAAAQFAAGLLDAQPGMRVLDACAAPGGKTCHVLESFPGTDLTAVERYANRLKHVQENLDRLGLECKLIVGDASEPDEWWDKQPYDRILLDAPCTATGVIRRHPEIRHHRLAEQVAAAVATQQTLLGSLWPLLAPGGMLLYATCSVFHDENSRQIANFLSRNSDAEECRIKAEWGLAQSHGRQILTGMHAMDGFYYALLRKRR